MPAWLKPAGAARCSAELAPRAITSRLPAFGCGRARLLSLEEPAQRLGHLGAAAMPLHLALASEAYPRGFAPHSLALSIGGSDGGERAVVVIGAPR